MSKDTKIQIRQSLILLLCAVIWGTAFVSQSVGMEYIGAFTFNGIRSVIGAISILPVLLFTEKKRNKKAEEQGYGITSENKKNNLRFALRAGIPTGMVLFVATNLQQFGIKYTTIGKAGFITAMYIIIVPLLGIFLKKKVSFTIWISVALSVLGLYLLCMKEQLSLQLGDSLVLGCAFAFSVQIMLIDKYSSQMNPVLLSFIQFTVSGILSCICMFLFEQPDGNAIMMTWKALIYAGVFSSGIAYTLQIVGQTGLNPTIASLIMSLESVVSAVSGFLFLQETMSGREALGCVLMFGAVILAQIPVSVFLNKKDKTSR